MRSALLDALNLRVSLMRTIAVLLLILATVAISSSSAAAGGSIKVVYPIAQAKIEAPSTFIIGAISPGDKLVCNGSPVKVTAAGYFAHVVQLKPGENYFNLTESGSVEAACQVKIEREIEPSPIGENDLRIVADSIQPKENRAVKCGDVVEFSVRATPNSQVKVELGKKCIYLRTLASQVGRFTTNHRPKTVNLGLEVAYGRVYQKHTQAKRDQYFGFYKIMPDDRWQQLHARIILDHNGKIATHILKQTITVLAEPLLAQTAHDATVVRLGPGAARTTPLSSGIHLLVDGWQGDQIRCLYTSVKHVWIAREDLIFDSNMTNLSMGAGLAPSSVAKTINIKMEDNYESVVLPLSQRLPYQVEQTMAPNRLKLQVYGVTADTDWVGNIPESSKMIDSVTWAQNGDNRYEVIVNIKGRRQWGYAVDYDGTQLQLHVRKPPKLVNAGRLDGLKICLDPGHGGQERGSIGPSGIAEADVNLAVP